MEKNTLEDLQKILAKLDPRRFSNIDIKNRVRLIRAIEIATAIGKVPTPRRAQGKNPYKFLQIGLTLGDNKLKTKIHNRLLSRIKVGMLKEAENLHRNGLTWKRMEELGLEYRYQAFLLQKKISKTEFEQRLETEIWHYAKRQKTWFKRDRRIKWFSLGKENEIQKEIKRFLD